MGGRSAQAVTAGRLAVAVQRAGMVAAACAAPGAALRPRPAGCAPAWAVVLAVTVTAVGVAPSCRRAPAAAAAQAAAALPPRLVILGFDGVDPRRVEGLLRAGRLPALAGLATRGHLGPLATTNPPQSPVAWATFATGWPAGEHGIFDFVGRSPQTYLPEVATTRVTHASVGAAGVIPASAENLRRGAAFWDVIAAAGVPTRTLMVPYAYPPVAGGAAGIAGLGAPDVRGTTSSFTLFTAVPGAASGPPPAGGVRVALVAQPGGTWGAALAGPRVRVGGVATPPQLPLTVARAGPDALEVRLDGVVETLAAGQTGAARSLSFAAGPGLTVAATTRLTVRAVSPPEIYCAPLGLHPHAPYLPLASPPSYAATLWDQLGAFKTVGWADDTAALGAGAIDGAQFLREARAHADFTARALDLALAAGQDRLLVAVFTAPDRIAHMFWRAAEASPAVDAAYVQMDAIVAAALARLRPQDRLVVMSDHGFAPFARGVHLNRWLVDAGYLVLQPGVTAPRSFFADIDWSRSRAFALGTGGIWLNVRGREARGIVSPAAAPALAAEIARGLEGLVDGGTRVVPRAYLGDAIFAGAQRAQAPDVRVAMAPGYRASWATTLGGIPATRFEDNRRAWSGDHASACPADVPGLLAATHALAPGPAPRIEDLAATAYAAMGVAPPAGGRGRPLWPAAAGAARP